MAGSGVSEQSRHLFAKTSMTKPKNAPPKPVADMYVKAQLASRRQRVVEKELAQVRNVGVNWAQK